MKKLFSIQSNSLIFAEKEGSVYGIFNDTLHKYIFVDSNGNTIDNYTQPSCEDFDCEKKIDDPHFIRDLGQGFYSYSTYEVEYDPDGEYGLLGIKHNNGEKLTEEIYYQIGSFSNGLCAVSTQIFKWGCINTSGDLVIPFNLREEFTFNKYGVAVGSNALIDTSGCEIPNTSLNSVDNCGESDRYFVFSLLSEEQLRSIDECGTAPNLTVNIYDTKNRAYIIKDVPECRLDVSFFDGEPEVILAAASLLEKYEHIRLAEQGTIFCHKDGFVTVYDYYRH